MNKIRIFTSTDVHLLECQLNIFLSTCPHVISMQFSTASDGSAYVVQYSVMITYEG